MCGIAGLITPQRDVAPALQRAAQRQAHRGPDAQGTACFEMGGRTVGFAHQRLAILDLSPAGQQPMTLEPHGSVILYNGEVYNYLELRQELLAHGYTFKGDSDTEVVLTALQHWGVEEALARFNGMWALAFLDPSRHRLYLARDRMGIKPLYTYVDGGQFYFASEIKTILAMAETKFPLNPRVVNLFLTQSLLDVSEETFFEGIDAFPAGHFAVLDLEASLEPAPRPYWTPSLETPRALPLESVIGEVRTLFMDAVRVRLRSDVPVGVLLSGGVDSSAIAGAMHHLLGDGADLNLLSAVSPDARYDESPFADMMAKHLRRDVHKVVLDFTPQGAMEHLKTVTWYNDEPVGSFSSVAHYLLMQAAKDLGVTVVLSGQGADELLCGYKKYLGFYVQHLTREGRYAEALKVLGQFWRRGTVLSQFSFQEAKRYLPGFHTSFRRQYDSRTARLKAYAPVPVGLGSQTVQERQLADLRRFSVPQLTHYEDRMSMAHAREVRLPFLDVRLVEMLLPLPINTKLRDGWTKYLFREALAPYLPTQIARRKDKQGFTTPQSHWLKHDLRAKVLETFNEEALIFKHDLLQRRDLLELYAAFCEQPEGGGGIWYKDVFNPLALEIWLRTFEEYLA